MVRKRDLEYLAAGKFNEICLFEVFSHGVIVFREKGLFKERNLS